LGFLRSTKKYGEWIENSNSHGKLLKICISPAIKMSVIENFCQTCCHHTPSQLTSGVLQNIRVFNQKHPQNANKTEANLPLPETNMKVHESPMEIGCLEDDS